MSRAWLVVLLALALAVGAAFALGLVGGDDATEDGGDALRGETTPRDGPTGPMRGQGGAGSDTEGADGTASLVGRPGESPLAPRPPRLRAASLRVVDASGVPLAGQVVSVFVGDALHGHFTTGADGLIHLTDIPVGEQVFVALGALDGKPDVVQPLTGDSLELRASNVLPLRVDVVDAQTGALLPGARWVFTTPDLRGGVGATYSGQSTPIHARPGVELQRPYAAETPPDFVDWDPPWEGVISRYATSVEARHPLRREASVTLQTVDKEKEDVREAQIVAFVVGGRAEDSPQTGGWMLGGVPLRGVPFFAGQPLRVWAQAPDGLVAHTTIKLPKQDHEDLTVELVLAKGRGFDNEPWNAFYGEPFSESRDAVRSGVGPDALMGALEVQVIRSDGRPAVGAHVRLPLSGEHRTDETGLLRIEKIVAGTIEAWLDEPGLVPVAEKVDVVAGEISRVTLQEPVGGTVVVTVKAADGTVLPHATVVVGQGAGTPWADVAPDGVQRLDPYTDERGRRVLQRVQPGRVRLDGWWGGWKGTLIVNAEDRQTSEVTLLVR